MGIYLKALAWVSILGFSTSIFAQNDAVKDLFHCSNSFFETSGEWLYLNPGSSKAPVERVAPRKMWFEHPSMDLFLIPSEVNLGSYTLFYQDRIYSVTADAVQLQAVFNNSLKENLDHYGLELILPDNQKLSVGIRNVDLVENARLHDADERVRESARKGLLINKKSELIVWADNPTELQFAKASLTPANEHDTKIAIDYVTKFLDLYVVYATRGVYTDALHLIDKAQQIPGMVASIQKDLEKSDADLHSLPLEIETAESIVQKYKILLKANGDKTIQELVERALAEATAKSQELLAKLTQIKSNYEARKAEVSFLMQVSAELPARLDEMKAKRSGALEKTINTLQVCSKIPALGGHIAEQLESLSKFMKNSNNQNLQAGHGL